MHSDFRRRDQGSMMGSMREEAFFPSYRPVGVATLKGTFEPHKWSPRERAFLVFEGFAYAAKVAVNGALWKRRALDPIRT